MAPTCAIRGLARRRAPAVAALVLAGLLGVRPGAGDEPPKPPPPTLLELAAQHAAAVESRDLKAQVRLLSALCETAAKAVADPKDEAATKAVDDGKKAARGLCRKAFTARDPDLLVAALGGYGTLAIPGSSAELKPFADVQLSEKRPLAVRRAALSAWAAIHDQGTHETVLAHIKLPSRLQEQQDLAVHAARCVARYRAVPKGGARYNLLRDFMQMFDSIYNSGMLFVSGDSATWWGLLHPVMVETFNALTLGRATSHAACVAWWRDNRRRVQAGTD